MMKTQNVHVGIVGAGIVGLATAAFLQQAGYKVTLIDRGEPGMGTSFGSAGLFADYACLPFTKFAMLRNMPRMLLDKTGPLSIQSSYWPRLLPYGLAFVKACMGGRYRQGKQALKDLQAHARQADVALLDLIDGWDLVRSEGCLGLFAHEENFRMARSGDLRERQEQGVELEFLGAGEVQAMEPHLSRFHAGGVYYPKTRFTVSPALLAKRCLAHILSQGAAFMQADVQAVRPLDHEVRVQLKDRSLSFDQVVMTTGLASSELLKPLGINIPLVSERGYHLMLDSKDKQLERPVGWLDKAIFLTPMEQGLRLAGTAEFAYADAPPSQQRTEALLQHASVMLGTTPEVKSSWVGSRPSTPDSLPVLGALEQHPRIKVAFGHGHLGLTFAAASGLLVREAVQGGQSSVDLKPFSASRFN